MPPTSTRFSGSLLSLASISSSMALSLSWKASDFSSPEVNQTTTVSELTVAAGALTAGGPYYWRARARNECGPGAWTTPRSFFALCASVPGAPTLVSPADGVTVDTFTPRLDWSDVATALGYQVQVSTSSGFSSPVVNATTVASEYTVPGGRLASETRYYWRARAGNACGLGPWSPSRQFRTPILRSIMLFPGVNQISLPVAHPSNAGGRMPYPCDPFNLLHEPLSVATWSNPAKAYTFGSASDLLTPGTGYFVEVETEESCAVAGTVLQPRWDLQPGWNLIGGASEMFNINPYLGECVITSGPWRWDDVARDYLREDTFLPGAGYFVNVAGPCTLGIATSTGFLRLDGARPDLSGPVLMDFADVPPSHFAYSAVASMRWLTITGGCSAMPPQFCPGQVITRAELGVFIARFLRLPAPASGEPYFADVPKDHVAFRYLQGLKEAGLTLGCAADPPLFCPDLPVTRAQMAVVLARALKLEAADPTAARFEDVPPSHWAAAEIAAVAESGLTQGCAADPPRYCPDELVTRGQVAVFLDRALRLGSE